MTYNPKSPPDRFPDRSLPEPEQIELAPPAQSTRPIPETSHSSVTQDLDPNSPRQKRLVRAFKEVIATHIANQGEKTTEEFLDELALALWKLTRLVKA